MDLNNLLQALQYSVGKTQDEIKMAEQFLSQAKTMEGFIPNLLLISCNKEVSAPVRLAAVINLKSVVQDNWEETPENRLFSQNDRATLRESIFDALITCFDVPKIYRQMEEIIKFIAAFDFPTVWKSILPNIVNRLKTSDKYAEIFGSLLTFKNLVVNYKHSIKQEREPLEVLVSTVFPLLEAYAKNLLSHYNEQAATAMHAILKTFHRAIEAALPKYFFNENVLNSWMTFLILIMDKPLGPELESPTEDANVIQQRAKNIFWLNKKICGRIISHFIVKYTFAKQTRRNSEMNMISDIFLQKYATSFLESTIKILYKKKEQYVPVKVQFFAMKYIYRALNYPSLQHCLLVHLEAIMFDFLIPAMYLTVEDNDDWNSNQIEFIRKEEDIHERANNLKSVAKDYFTSICANNFFAPDGELFSVKFMKYAAHVLSTNTDPRTNQQADLRLREAVLHIFGVLKDSILANDFLRPNVEYILENFVAPECKNQVGFLRYRASWLYGIYGGLKYEKGQNIEVALKNLFDCLEDTDFPVRVNAGISLNSVLRQPGAIEVLKPVLQKVLETYITLIDLIDNDGLVKALEGIIEKFENDIHPYAFELVQHLTKTFLKVHQDNHAPGNDNDESEDEGEQEERGVAASGYLTAIAKIIKCGLDKEMLVRLEDVVAPIIQFTLSEEGMEYVDAGLGLLSSFLYNCGEISERMWQFYPELNYMIAGKPQQQNGDLTGWGYEFLDSILPCLQNYIQKGKNIIFAAMDPYLNISYLQLLLRSIDRVYELYYKKKNQIEAPIISVLFITLLENYPKQIDDLIPVILNKVTGNLNVQDTDLRKVLTQIAAMCFWYDAGLCFGLLGTEGTEFVFQNWMKLLPEFNQDYECQRLMFGLASILRQDVMKLPTVVLNALPVLLKEMVNLSSKTLVLREKDDEEEAEEDEEEKKTLLQIMGDPIEEDDDDEDDEDYNYLDELEPTEKGEYKSPLEEQCEVLYLQDTLKLLQQNQPDAYNQLISCLDNNEQQTLLINFSKAENQQTEYEKFKQEEDQKRQQLRVFDVSRL